MATVTLRNARKSFGDVHIIKGVDLDIADGEFCVFVGPSGCGKSTLLRMIAGLEDITSGSLQIGGREMRDVEPADRGVAMVFQSYALYPHMTVKDNIGFGLRMTGHDRADIEKRTQRAAEMLQLGPLLARKPSQLSGGQRQRVAIGRAIVREPDVFLFDEPLSNLDAALRVQMRIEIGKLHQDLGATMIYVTHDQVEAMTMADKIALLDAGHVEQFAPPDELYARPATLFAAGFIGTPPMNLLPLKEADAACWARSHMVGRFPEGPIEEVVLGVRPEKISLADSGLPAEVLSLEYLGADSLIAGKVGASEWIVRQAGKIRLAAGDRIHLTWQETENHWFEAKSGKRCAA
jgi:multiple sugar transport system ATP-binding protein